MPHGMKKSEAFFVFPVFWLGAFFCPGGQQKLSYEWFLGSKMVQVFVHIFWSQFREICPKGINFLVFLSHHYPAIPLLESLGVAVSVFLAKKVQLIMESLFWNQPRFSRNEIHQQATKIQHQQSPTWRIIPVSKWLITMVRFRPLGRVGALPNGHPNGL